MNEICRFIHPTGGFMAECAQLGGRQESSEVTGHSWGCWWVLYRVLLGGVWGGLGSDDAIVIRLS